ncbi:GNAT family N-acetyltransferase [Halobacillus campisalis]|uniref:GNAT family N-acetyltransferase n=1 Tax=Halobacillus campisalis TaxID=435909 RepID=A0ABW2K5B4_9BACI|nr:GNAT family N-acetyltransferase [Halobacillus campisalis]
MVKIQKASIQHIEGIAKVCSEGNWATYRNLCSDEYIARVIKEFYNYDRIYQEVTTSNKGWGGYYVALEGNNVLGACGGGMKNEKEAEVYVLYLDPDKKNQGIGSLLLEAVTKQQTEFGAEEQWVSVQKGNDMGTPFYEARGFTFMFEDRSYANQEEEQYISCRYHRYI